ncbi:MAG: hypothetical protein AB1Z98_19550 [Nannocystaceae bacterium]
MHRRPFEAPLARAQAHHAAARYPQAIGAYRAAVQVDPTVLRARLGLADALAAHGRCGEAVDGLVAASGDFVARQQHDDAMCLIGKALALDPGRLDLHLDVAIVEEAAGQHEAALVRVEGLADLYMNEGRTEEAAELLRFVASWGQPQGEAPEQPEPPHRAEQAPSAARITVVSVNVDAVPAPEPMPVAVPLHAAVITGATVIARNPLLAELDSRASSPVEVPPTSDTVVCMRFDADAMMADEPTTVARAPSAPVRLQVGVDVELLDDADALLSEPAPRPRAALVLDPDLDMVTRVASVQHLRPRPRRSAPPPPPAAPLSRGNPLTDRLRARAGLRGPSGPRAVRVRPTEPLSVRQAMRRPSVPDEEVTLRYRRPRGLVAAS